MRHFPTVVLVSLIALSGCGDAPEKTGGADEPAKTITQKGATAPATKTGTPTVAGHVPAKPGEPPKAAPPPVDPNDPLAPRTDLPPEDRVLIVIDDHERWVAKTAAVEAGYTVVNLGDQWTPTIFKEAKAPSGRVLLNQYRRIYLGLAADEIDGDGLPLEKNELNFLEVFGIPPNMSTVAKRLLDDEKSECLQQINYKQITAIEGMTYRKDWKQARHEKNVVAYRKELIEALEQTGAADFDELATKRPKLIKKIKKVQLEELEQRVLAEVDKRLNCDNHNHKRYKHKPGKLDRGLRLALRRFQRKHKLYEHTNLRDDSLKYLGMPPKVTNHKTIVRVLQERVAEAAGIVEDGSAHKRREKATWKNDEGETVEVRNLIEEFTQALLNQLRLDTPDKALAFFGRHGPDEIKTMQVGVKFPELPAYYSKHMQLFIRISRGSVWYDPPLNADKTKIIRQRRPSVPWFSLYTKYKDQEIRLVRWRTTIGGWRKEQASNGHLYLKYKNSDVGKRVIRNVIAGPTWVAPETTPTKSLAKRRWINGKSQGVVNYNEMGPGYLSAYGLVAGYFVKPRASGRDIDNGIRAHGSSDYMSILSHDRFSHGCHRLMNHLAVRLYGFMLSHRRYVVRGTQPMKTNRQFYRDGEVYQIRIPSRGFLYEMTPPVPVNVFRGRIHGSRRSPIRDYIEIPGVKYPKKKEEVDEDAPEDAMGGQ